MHVSLGIVILYKNIYRLGLHDLLLYTDIDECVRGTHNCTVDGAAPAQCDNLPGGFRCSCDHLEGYIVNTIDYKSCKGMYGMVRASCKGMYGMVRASCHGVDYLSEANLYNYIV